MNLHEIEKGRRRLRHAGTVADRAHFRQSTIARLSNDIEVIGQRKAAIKNDFRERSEKWETRAKPEHAPIVANPGDAQDSRLYRMTAWIALLCETGLAAWIFMRLGVSAWIGALTALGITFTLHGVFLYVFEDEERPKETVYRIKHYAATPAIIGFVIAVAGGALARYVTGDLAYMLLPLFSFSLWLGTLSLIILAASLFTIAHLRGWARRHEKEYQKLDTAERGCTAFLKELEEEEQKASDPAQHEKPTPAPSGAASRNIHNIGAMLLFAALILSNSGCVGTPSNAASDQASAIAVSLEAMDHTADLHVFIDWSGSCTRPALDEAWATVESELPEIVEQHRIGKLTIWSFDQDGWCPNRLLEARLPSTMVAGRAKLDGGEWESFANIRDAVREHEVRESKKRQEIVQSRYHRELQQALLPIESASILPDMSHETPQSDIVGLFERISAMHDRRAQYVIVLTDMAETRRKVWPKLATPKGDLRVLVLAVPAEPNDALLTLGKPLSGPEQFEVRQRQLGEMAPWVSSAPYFARNIAELLKPRASNGQ
ncbi:MAG TPA: hypothetical protein VE422_30740 [Terriglobia bacterium]|nr:hypothetical protein [Terriglobia bacterium]